LACVCLLGLVTLTAAERSVTGIFRGNGNDAYLAFATAHAEEPFSGKETVIVILTERDTGGEQHPEIMASFGKFGSAFIVTFTRSRHLVGTEVAHTAHKKTPFSSLGELKVEDFHIEQDEVRGRLSTGGEVESLSQTWEVNLSFRAELT
jgi:hypothetical protein